MEKIYSMQKWWDSNFFWSGTPTFSSGTPTFSQMGVLNSCFQNPSESSVSVKKLSILFNKLPFIPLDDIFFNKRWWLTLSKALARSK